MNTIYVCPKCGQHGHRPGACTKGHGTLKAICPNCRQPPKDCTCN